MAAAAAFAACATAATAATAADLRMDTEKEFGKNAGVTVSGIRLGPHPDKLRIVLDATGPVNFDYWISKGGRNIVVLIPEVKWSAPTYLRLGDHTDIYRISFFPNPTGGGVLSILGRKDLGLSAIEQLGPDEGRPYRVVFDIPKRQENAWMPAGGVMRDGKLLPAHDKWPPVLQADAGHALPLIRRQDIVRSADSVGASASSSPLSYGTGR